MNSGDPQNKATALKLAKQGNPKAIEVLINHHLQPKGITVSISLKNNSLQVMLESSTVPNQQVLIAFLKKGLENLNISTFREVQVFGKQIDEVCPDWHQAFELENKQSISLEELGKAGDILAIETLINQWVEFAGSTAKVTLKDECLRIMLQSLEIPNDKITTPLICKGVIDLGIQIKEIRIYGQQLGSDSPDWSENIRLDDLMLTSSQTTDTKTIPSSNTKIDNDFNNKEINLEIELKSEQGIDYTKLRDLLANQEYYRADKETWDVMCKVLDKPVGSYFGLNDFTHFPCQDLWTIDRLWVTYSKGRYGFSVQGEIYKDLKWDLAEFKEVVGWKRYIFDDQNFLTDEILSKTGKRGFLPCLVNYKGKVLFATEQIQLTLILDRLRKCEIYV